MNNIALNIVNNNIISSMERKEFLSKDQRKNQSLAQSPKEIHFGCSAAFTDTSKNVGEIFFLQTPGGLINPAIAESLKYALHFKTVERIVVHEHLDYQHRCCRELEEIRKNPENYPDSYKLLNETFDNNLENLRERYLPHTVKKITTLFPELKISIDVRVIETKTLPKMVLQTCMDSRISMLHTFKMQEKLFLIRGAAAGATNFNIEGWALAYKIYQITEGFVINHQNCGGISAFKDEEKKEEYKAVTLPIEESLNSLQESHNLSVNDIAKLHSQETAAKIQRSCPMNITAYYYDLYKGRLVPVPPKITTVEFD